MLWKSSRRSKTGGFRMNAMSFVPTPSQVVRLLLSFVVSYRLIPLWSGRRSGTTPVRSINWYFSAASRKESRLNEKMKPGDEEKPEFDKAARDYEALFKPWLRIAGASRE
jgi:hypothetical protein